MKIDDLADDRETKARAAFLGRKERLEQPRLDLLIDSRAMIGNQNAGAFTVERSCVIEPSRCAGVLHQLRRDIYGRAWFAGIDGIRQQVDEDLAQLFAVPV